MTGKIDPLFAGHPFFQEQQRQTAEFVAGLRAAQRPSGSNADEWHLFLTEYCDNRATQPSGMTYVAVQIAEAIEQAMSQELTNYKLGFATQTEERERLQTENENLRDVISEALIHAEHCWVGHYGDNPEGGSEPHHIQRMRAALLPKDGTP